MDVGRHHGKLCREGATIGAVLALVPITQSIAALLTAPTRSLPAGDAVRDCGWGGRGALSCIEA